MVPYRDAADTLPGLLAALAEQTVGADAFEVLLVDDGSSDGGLDEASLPSSLEVRRLSSPGRGAYAARNAGIRAARGSALAFTDADCQPSPTWLERGLAALDESPRVAGHVTMTVSAERSVAERLDDSRFLRQERYAREGFGATANLFWRRSVVDVAGLFDDRLISGADEEHGERAVSRGLPIRYAEDAVVLHPARRTLYELARKAERVGVGVGQKLRLKGVDPRRLFRRVGDRLSLLPRAPREADEPFSTRVLLASGHAGLAVCTGVGVARGLLLGERALSRRR